MGDDLRVVLAYDIGPGIGLGHRRRMEAMAAALDRVGLQAELTEVVPGIVADLAVIDSYVHRPDDRSIVDAAYVVAIDDLGRDLAVDLVVDPGDNATSPPDRARHVLTGLRFAPLDPALRDRADPSTRPVRRVLVTMGAADAAGRSSDLARRIAAAEPDREVRHVIGPWSLSSAPPGVTAVTAPSGLADQLLDADVVVTSGGVTLLEALCLGRCVIVVETAANQRGAIAQAVNAGAALESDPDDVPALVTTLARGDVRRGELARNASALVDGRGADRIVEYVLSSAPGLRSTPRYGA